MKRYVEGRFGATPIQYLIARVATVIKNARHFSMTPTDLLTNEPFVNIQDHIKEIFGSKD